MSKIEGSPEKELTLPDVFQHGALLLAAQSNETILRVMKGEDSTGGKSPRGSVLDRPALTTAERRRRFAQRKKLRQLGKPGDEEAQQDENLLAEAY